MSEPKTLVLTETGVAHLPDGTTAINVGPIVRALEFLTEGRGDDRGTDELGNPLPDLMSLAFDVVQSIILGGRKADHFRRVKQELETQVDAPGSSLALAKQAKRVQTRALPTALDEASDQLKSMLGELESLTLEEQKAQELQRALETFRSFGAERWVAATAQLLVAVSTLGVKPARASEAAPSKRARSRRRAPSAKPARAKPAAPKRASSTKLATKARPKTKQVKRKPKRR